MGKRKAVDSSPAVLHADDADKADTKRTRQALDQDATAAKAAPVLQWMRVPIALQGSVALALQHVRGLDPALAKSLEQGTQCWNRMPTRRTFFLHQQLAYRACIQCKPRCGTSPPVVPALNTTSALAPPPAAVKHFPICSQCCKVSSGTQNPYRTSHIAVKCLHRVGTRGLSALVVVPSKDLAKQVFHVLQQLCPPIGLTAALVNGQLSEAQEAAALEAQCPAGPTTGAHPRSLSAQSTAQLVVATPGRLVAHLQAGLSLSALQFLVVDEVDRLMRQSYNQWLPLVLQALGAPTQQVGRAHSLTGEHDRGTQLGIQGALETSCHRVVKLVASATITTDPAKLARLELHAPRYVALSATDHRHSLPSTLKEFRVMCSDGDKGLVLLCLLGTMVGQQTIVFAASVDATHRVWLLLSAAGCCQQQAVEYSSRLSASQRAANLRAFSAGQAQVLVCSDAMTRGMDVPEVANVINYDAPVYVKTYVHRAGRTARAGRNGQVVTLLRDKDVRHFKDMLRKADNNYVQQWRIAREEMEGLRGAFEAAVQAMQEALQGGV